MYVCPSMDSGHLRANKFRIRYYILHIRNQYDRDVQHWPFIFLKSD